MYKQRYDKRKGELLGDKDINPKNREVMSKFFEYEEYKLKRKQGLTEVDERSYKTLYYYTSRLRNLNNWFNNKDWTKLKKEDIKKLIDDLEDGNIKTFKGSRFSDRSLYYQMLQGKLFDIAGKSSYAIEIFKEFNFKGRDDPEDVRFIDEETFRNIVEATPGIDQKCLLWLAWDIGENINSLLDLERDDFKRQFNDDTKEPEYLVILSKEKLKRSRTPRSEITNYPETVKFLDMVLAKEAKERTWKIRNKGADGSDVKFYNKNILFQFTITRAGDFLTRAVEKVNARCLPGGHKVTWKDLRSSMSCDLLKKGWSRDEVNARLGHKPSSRIIDRYINYLALDKGKPKKKVYESNMKKIEDDLEQNKEVNKLQGFRIEKLNEELDKQKLENKDIKTDMDIFKQQVLKEMEKNIEKQVREQIEIKKIN